jgi:hypothetical protein
MQDQTYLTPEEAAKFLRLSAQHLANLRCKRLGPPYLKVSPHAVRYRLDDLIAYLERTRVNLNE